MCGVSAVCVRTRPAPHRTGCRGPEADAEARGTRQPKPRSEGHAASQGPYTGTAPVCAHRVGVCGGGRGRSHERARGKAPALPVGLSGLRGFDEPVKRGRTCSGGERKVKEHGHGGVQGRWDILLKVETIYRKDKIKGVHWIIYGKHRESNTDLLHVGEEHGNDDVRGGAAVGHVAAGRGLEAAPVEPAVERQRVAQLRGAWVGWGCVNGRQLALSWLCWGWLAHLKHQLALCISGTSRLSHLSLSFFPFFRI